MTTAVADIRLLVSDVDGTLVDHDKQLTAATVAAVARLRAAGIGFALISARPRSGILPLADALGLDGPLAAFNGGTVFRPAGGILEQHRVPSAIALDVLAAAGASGATTWVFADDRWYAGDDRDPHTPRERRSTFQEPTVTADLPALAERIDKITIVSDDRPLLDELTERLGRAHGQVAAVSRSQDYYLDVTAQEANKGAGVAALAKLFGVPLAQVATIGDMPNDLPMFARAGLSIAMGQAPAAVRDAADWVTGANDQDGVAATIDRLLGAR